MEKRVHARLDNEVRLKENTITMSAPEPSSDRARQAAKILEHPGDYKVCEGCGSIVTSRSLSCPSCHAYAFDEDSARVTQQAALLARRSASSVLSSDLT
jgi:hypothetical protein